MFITKPTFLKTIIKLTDETNCPICNTILDRKIINIKTYDECYECSQDDINCLDDKECTCIWYKKNILQISCYKCIEDQIL